MSGTSIAAESPALSVVSSSSSVDDDNCGGCPVRCCAVRKGNDFRGSGEGGSARASNRLPLPSLPAASSKSDQPLHSEAALLPPWPSNTPIT